MRKSIVLCEKQGEILYLKDYARVLGEVNEKLRTINKEALFLRYGKKTSKVKIYSKRGMQ